VQYFEKGKEAEFKLLDLTGNFQKEIIDAYPNGGFIYLDAHPYALTKEVLNRVLANGKWCLAIHDCGKHLCNPSMDISWDRPDLITSNTGHWERHVFAEVFGFKSPFDQIDQITTTKHRIRIIESMHGLAIIAPT
jgi:hypothetical protein